MKNVHNEAKKSFDKYDSIYPVLEKLTTRSELDELIASIKGKRNAFTKTVRSEVKAFQREFKRTIRFNSKVDIIDDLIYVPHILRNGDITKAKFHFLSRALATGAIRELTPMWTGMVSKEAIKNAKADIKKTKSVCRSTYSLPYLNSNEHFYNNLYAASVVLCYKLYFDDDRTVLEDMCKVFQQVHITTAKENSKLAHNGQNETDRMGWKEAYKLNKVHLVDVKVQPVQILSIKDVAPKGLIEMTMDMRNGWKD